MMTRKICLAACMGGVMLAMLASAAPSYAILPWYDFRTGTWQRSGRTQVVAVPVAVAAPVVAAPACNPCATTACSPVTTCQPCATTCASPVVNYVAETSYRVQIVNRPVTTFHPVVTPGACGTCVTSFMPVTTMVAQTQQVPVTTYRPVVSFMPAQCATCPTTACAAPACPTGCATAACPSGSCGGVAQASGTIDEAPSLQAAPIPAQTAPQPLQPQLTPQPESQPPSQEPTSGPHLYPEAQARASRGLDTIPSSSPARSTIPAPLQDLRQDGLKPVAPPQLLDPNDKTAMRVEWTPRPRVRVVNDSGWRAAH